MRGIQFALIFFAALASLGAAPSTESFQTQVDTIVSAYVSRHEFSGNVLVARWGQTLFEKSYGIADRSNAAPIAEDSRFILASISKPLVATLILQQVEEGRIGLEDSIQRFLPDTPKSWQAVTIEHLLTHSSGIYDYLNSPDLDKIRYQQMSPKELIDRYKLKPLGFQPGSKYSYSNLGYVILAYVLEQVTGVPFSQLLSERILKPLGMGQSGVWGFDDENMNPRAIGYAWTGSKWTLPNPMDPSIAYGCGDVFASTHDLLAFDQALYSKTLLSESMRANMFTPRHDEYGLGFRVKTYNGHRVVFHNGHLVGNLNRFARYVDDGLTIILLGNADGGKVTEISDQIAAASFGEEYVPRPLESRREDLED